MIDGIKLTISIIADLIGMLSYFVPWLGEITDIVYAPLYALWIKFAYKNTTAAILGGLEEILPFFDAIPTATITHFYEARKKSKK